MKCPDFIYVPGAGVVRCDRDWHSPEFGHRGYLEVQDEVVFWRGGSNDLTGVESKAGGVMDREQLEGAQATLRGLRDTLATGAENPPDANYDRLAGAIDAVAGVVTALVEAELVKTEHANAVAEEIKRPRTLDHGHGAVKGGPGWPEVERADRSDKFHDPEEITGHGRY